MRFFSRISISKISKYHTIISTIGYYWRVDIVVMCLNQLASGTHLIGRLINKENDH